MGLLDFLFGSKKKEQERQRLEEEARRQKLEEERIARERERRLEENRRKERERQEALRAEREKAQSIEPFTFKSNCHQRYENDIPVKGLQECLRTVSVVKNTSGCPGYLLEPGIGYIVKIYNDDLGKPNMSDKPMKVVRKSDTSIELRGFPIKAQTPFGWQEVDYTDYGLIVYYNKGAVEKCVLHMYDRNTRIEYCIKSGNKSQESPNAKDTVITETETFVNEALQQLSRGNDGDATYHPLYKAWQSYRRNPSQLKSIKDFGRYGMGLMIFLSYGTVTDIDDRQQLASISYLFLSKAIAQNASDVNLLKNRLILMITNHEAFEYTVSSVVNKGGDFFMYNLNPFKARDAMFKMEYADLSRDSRLLSVDILSNKYRELSNKISTQFFGPNETISSIIQTGNKHHSEVLKYIENKVLDEEDIEF